MRTERQTGRARPTPAWPPTGRATTGNAGPRTIPADPARPALPAAPGPGPTTCTASWPRCSAAGPSPGTGSPRSRPPPPGAGRPEPRRRRSPWWQTRKWACREHDPGRTPRPGPWSPRTGILPRCPGREARSCRPPAIASRWAAQTASTKVASSTSAVAAVIPTRPGGGRGRRARQRCGQRPAHAPPWPRPAPEISSAIAGDSSARSARSAMGSRCLHASTSSFTR